MKRLNPKTGLPFKQSDVREDGHIFFQYKNNQIKLDGFCHEIWLNAQSFEKQKSRKKQKSRERNKTNTGRSKTLLRSAERRTELKGGVITITLDWVEVKINTGLCELSGLPFSFDRPKLGNRNNPYSPSIDRIDNTNPDYTPENCRVVLTVLNQAISDYGLDTLIQVFKPIIESQL